MDIGKCISVPQAVVYHSVAYPRLSCTPDGSVPQATVPQAISYPRL